MRKALQSATATQPTAGEEAVVEIEEEEEE